MTSDKILFDTILFQLQHSTNMQVLVVLHKYIKANITTHLKILLVYIDAVCFWNPWQIIANLKVRMIFKHF